MSILFLLPVLVLVIFLVFVFFWSLRGTATKTLDQFRAADFECAGRRHATHGPQIRQALDGRDLQYLASAGGAHLARRVRRDRGQVVKDYLIALRGDFDQLLRLARAIAALSPEVVAVEEFERLRLTVQFHLRCRIIYFRLLLGAATLPQISGVSDLVSHLAARLETALQELGERAALAVELASSPDRRDLNAV
jgi:hypothetical protein